MIAELPTRRDEDWRYSDLRAALRDDPLVLREADHVIARLAPGTQTTTIPAGETRLFVETMDSAYRDARAFEFNLEDQAALTRVIVQTGDAPALSLARVRLGAGASFTQFIYSEGARLARLETQVDVHGSGAQVALHGVYLVAQGRHADLTSVVTHHAPGASTNQVIKGAARAGGRGVFQGRIVVERPAQKTDARQYHHALLLEDGAEIDAKPELEIYADDVACAHGNTAGGLSEDQIFYLRARGIPEAQARALLTEAFLIDAMPEALPQALREDIIVRLRAWLGAQA
ncbi:MAG: Fe-S cluster assembly protein SufD [Alphaproteobacteria bacterium]|nr:Fe-S cluster assembly protein SufD [Alphaproteobacteria bacterium]